MKVIAQKLWREPAVVIGLLVSLALLVLAILSDSFDASSIAGIVAPFAAALGIRQFVTPANQGGSDASSGR